MTVVSAMKFNNGHGAIVSDERNSRYVRHDDLANKLVSFEHPNGSVKMIVGASGVSPMINKVHSEYSAFLRTAYDRITGAQHMIGALNHIITNCVDEFRDNYLKRKCGVSQLEFQTGVKNDNGKSLPIDSILKDKYNRLIDGGDQAFNEFTNNVFLCLVSGESGIDIYSFHMMNPLEYRLSKPYESIGSGADRAESSLSDFFENMKREDREDIEPVQGISELIYATERASKKNIGVGGVPHVAHIAGDVVSCPNERETKLAQEIILAYKNKFVDNDFHYYAVSQLLLSGTGKYDDINREFWKYSKEPDKMREFLMGYK